MVRHPRERAGTFQLAFSGWLAGLCREVSPPYRDERFPTVSKIRRAQGPELDGMAHRVRVQAAEGEGGPSRWRGWRSGGGAGVAEP